MVNIAYCKNIMDLILANLTRIVYCIQSVFCIYLICSIMKNYFNLMQIILIVIIIVDSIYICLFNDAKEHAWFSISSFSYTVIMIINICQVMFLKSVEETCDDENGLEGCHRHNKTEKAISSSNSYWIPETFLLCHLSKIISSIFILTLIVGRWLIPNKSENGSKKFLDILIQHIYCGADSIELLSNAYDNKLENYKFVYITVISIFSLSTIQFSFILNNKKLNQNFISNKKNVHNFLIIIFGTEIWSILLVFLVQDFPYLIVRILLLFVVKLSDILFFFMFKNLILCLVQIHKIISIYHEEKILLRVGPKNNNQLTLTEVN